MIKKLRFGTPSMLRALIAILLTVSISAQVPEGYYDPAAGKTGAALKEALHDIIKGHTEFPYTSSSTDVWDILKETDRDPNNSANVITIYGNWSRNAAAEYDNGSGWNREHVWAKSHGDFGETPPAGTDVHHIRAADVTTNSARGNKDFDNGGEQYIDRDSGPTDCYADSDSWEPRDAVKGDVARMLFYMAVRYEGDVAGEPDLELVDQVNSIDLNTVGHGYHGKLSALMEWHVSDPVDDWERNRNDIIYYNYQHNRNPFIDHPEYAELIWGDSPSAPASPSNLTATNITRTSLTLSWSDNSDNEEGFNIYQNGTPAFTVSANVASYALTGLSPSARYTFAVEAFNSVGVSGIAEITVTMAANDYTIMTYNLENWGEYPGDDEDRKADLRTVINSIQPDIIIAEEIWGTSAYEDLLNNVLNYSEILWDGGFIDQSNVYQDIAVFYKPEFFTHIGTDLVECSYSDYYRDALEVRLRDKIMNTEFYIYGVHLKANTSSDISNDISIRAQQTSLLRSYLNDLPDSSYFIVAGDFNILNASEGGWQNLTKSATDNSGRVFDPIDQVGEWNDNEVFAPYHTHSTRYSSYYPNSSGLRSRLDFILISDAVRYNPLMNYVTDTYLAYGNDGEHFGSSVNWNGNDIVPVDVAAALYEVSDHLPVIARFDFSGIDTVYQPEFADLFFSEYIEGGSYNKALEIYNPMDIPIELNGYSIISNSNGGSWSTARYDFPEDAVLQPGDVWVLANSSADQAILDVADETLETTASGYVVGFNGNDVRALVKIIDADTTILDIIGLYPDPQLTDGWSVAGVTAATENHTLVRKAEIESGNPDWSLSAGTNADNSEWIVYNEDTFDYLGVHPGMISGLIGLCNGSNDLNDYRLYPCYPNPFNPATTIGYDLRRAANVTLYIYDLRGNVINTLVHAEQQPGHYTVTWNGRNNRGQSVSAGVYLYHMQTDDGFKKTGKMILLK